MKSFIDTVDSSSSRSNFKKLSARNFQLSVNPVEVGISSVVESAVGIVLSDNRYASLNGRAYSLTFLKGFNDINAAEHIAQSIRAHVLYSNAELKPTSMVTVDRDDNTKFTIVFKTQSIV
jgi:hypothetical protein